MTDIFHCIGICGDNHPSVLTFVFGHLEVVEYLKLKFFNQLNTH